MYTLAVPRAFDVAYAVGFHSGSFLSGLPEARDRRPLVREALLTGYRETNPTLADRVADPPTCYGVMAALRGMTDLHHLELPGAYEGRVAERLRADVASAIRS